LFTRIGGRVTRYRLESGFRERRNLGTLLQLLPIFAVHDYKLSSR
jgi:hypothetical protein